MAALSSKGCKASVADCGRFGLTEVWTGGDAVRRRLRDVPGQQFVQPVDRMVADAGEHIPQPSLGLETAEFGRAYQRVEDRGPVTPASLPAKSCCPRHDASSVGSLAFVSRMHTDPGYSPDLAPTLTTTLLERSRWSGLGLAPENRSRAADPHRHRSLRTQIFRSCPRRARRPVGVTPVLTRTASLATTGAR